MIVDKTGRKIKIGQPVDVMMLGMFHGKIVAIKDVPIQLSREQAIPPHIIIVSTITPYIRQDGCVPDVYILGEPDPKDPVVLEALEHEGKLIKPS